MLLSYTELCNLIAEGVIANSDLDNVNSSSIDLTLGNNFILEHYTGGTVSYSDRQKLTTIEHYVKNGDSLILRPGEFVLAHTKEIFNLPLNISGEYKLKSSMARIGLEHLNAGWCDAGWTGSALTLEFKNMTQHHTITLSPGDKIGQIVFFKHAPVPIHRSYVSRGRYNQDSKVSEIKE